MVPIKTLAVGGLAGLAALAASAPALAIPVTPIVSNATAAAVTIASVPNADPTDPVFPAPLMALDIDVKPSSVAVPTPLPLIGNIPLTNIPLGAETADGAVAVDLNLADINQSVARARSKVFTADSPAAPVQDTRMTNGSIGGLSATLSTTGLAPGDTATVDLLLRVAGLLTYSDPGGTAGTVPVIDPTDDTIIEVPDMSANVSVILALANIFAAIDFPIPDPLPFNALFNGGATLQSVSPNTKPELVRTGSWKDPARDGDFQFVGACTTTFCQVSVAMSLLFTNVQSLGFDENFEVGLLLQTNADAISDQGQGVGRMIESNFFNSANFALSLELAPLAEVPEPAPIALLALALLALGFASRARRVRRPA